MKKLTVKVLVNADSAFEVADELAAIAKKLHRTGDAGLCYDEAQTLITNHEIVGLIVCTKNAEQA